MQYYNPPFDATLRERQTAKQSATDILSVRGTDKKPDAPRDVTAQSGSRKALVTWKAPVYYQDIKKWRVYKDTEENLYKEVSDSNTRQMSVELSSGATPPVTPIFVSAVNGLGYESRKVQVNAVAITEGTAPADPKPPIDFEEDPRGGFISRKQSYLLYGP
jgi:hypothetical protein